MCGPVIAFFFLKDQRLWAIGVLLLAVSSDYLDGLVARQFKIISSSAFWAYLDSLADFTVVLTAYTGFVVAHVYPPWVLLLPSVYYLQFLLSSGRRIPRYDPLGKYAGLIFDAAIFVTICCPQPIVALLLLVMATGYTIFSMLSRVIFLRRAKRYFSISRPSQGRFLKPCEPHPEPARKDWPKENALLDIIS